MSDLPDSALHRAGESGPLGKLDASIAFRLESATKDAFAAVASREGKGASEFLREIMRLIAYGPDKVVSMHADRIKRVARMLNDVRVQPDPWRDE